MAFGFLFHVFLFIAQLIAGLLLILFSLPFLFFNRAPPAIVSTPPPLPDFPIAPAMAPTSNEILALIRSIFLWGVLIVIVVFAIVQFVRQRGEIVPALRNHDITNWLLLAWQWLYRNVEKTRGGLSRLVTAGWQSISSRLEGKQILPP